MVGETGAGKTTTALAIMQLLPKTGKILSGSMTFDERNLLKLSDEEMRLQIRGERIAMIFQDPMTALNPVMTVGEQISRPFVTIPRMLKKKKFKESK
ncbi:ATP-binding cassette domain-containing protein [Candidatus Amarolinea dominans]|uniref:ATP-binding cassette domain-containing protein n=1 Tax=Candidatus Amarolinea dominans TaxID=3140696 RepID=UPI0031CC651C